EAAQPCGRADAVGVVDHGTTDDVLYGAGGFAVVLGTVLEFVVAVPACSTGDREYLRDDVKVDGSEECRLLVAALVVLAERGVGSGPQVGIDRVAPGSRPYR